MSMTAISPQKAKELADQGALLVDIRAADEYAREHIAQARHLPLEKLTNGAQAIEGSATVIFHCRSGNRTQLNAQALAACVDCDAYLLEGGLDAWKKAGFPIITDKSQPLELQRQVQIAAGTLIVVGVLLGITVSPGFYAIPGFVGAGLIFAGISGFCGMARLLARMPWNRRHLAG